MVKEYYKHNDGKLKKKEHLRIFISLILFLYFIIKHLFHCRLTVQTTSQYRWCTLTIKCCLNSTAEHNYIWLKYNYYILFGKIAGETLKKYCHQRRESIIDSRRCTFWCGYEVVHYINIMKLSRANWLDSFRRSITLRFGRGQADKKHFSAGRYCNVILHWLIRVHYPVLQYLTGNTM